MAKPKGYSLTKESKKICDDQIKRSIVANRSVTGSNYL